MKRRTLAAAMTVALGAGALGAVGVTPAYAVTCSGYSCDHQDPIATGCNTGAYTVTSAPVTFNGVSYGTVELRWSPACQTNWSRLTIAAGPSNPNHLFRGVEVYRQSPADYDSFSWVADGSPIYGNMLYSPGCAKAYAYIEFGNYTNASGTAVEPGCSF